MAQALRHLMLLAFGASLSVAGRAAAEEPEGAADAMQPEGDLIRDIVLDSLDDGSVVAAGTAQHALASLLRRGLNRDRDAEAVIARLVRRTVEKQGAAWIDQVAVAELERQLLVVPKHEAAHAEVAAFDIPLADHPLVDAYIDYFTGRGHDHFAKWLGRLERYRPLMEPVLVKAGVPKDLVYVALVESGLSAGALSRAAACGYWQFIRSTGSMYGLRMDFWVDERRDFIRATESAARYMRSLYGEFGDWHLAWASYNAGSGRVRRALSRYQASDFWTLVGYDRSLAKETRHYVPKIIAAALIAKDRARYGFGAVVPETPLVWEEVTVNDAVDLRLVARRVKVSLEAMRELNPAILHDVTPPGRSWRLRVPAGQAEVVSRWLEELPAAERLTYRHYAVQRGDTLGAIAKRYGTTIVAISEFNRIRNPRALRLGQDLIIPTVRAANVSRVPVASSASSSPKVERALTPRRVDVIAATVARASSSQKTGTPAKGAKAQHVVKKGETLWSIAMRYGLGIEDLKSKNGRRHNDVMAGERLRIF
ncbi:MAG: LysM peptidoglycan-binding domain-containing protein [Deltaproteobacteria bacterium]|nr:LysM peptidoglycan-binding domain-containing protein [Deltaproteobacteria bacterium]